ncbi:hypothetical protein BGZ46_002808 [Entomortierella lignicola]|nr:hypothetical protein BGZ46_002808 [Entomortierella lignicola]
MSEIKVFTNADLANHSTRDNLYLAIEGKVYDVTKFIDEHPGGEEVLLDESGKDATEAFEDVGHSDEARDMLTKMFGGKKAAPATKTATTPKSDSGRLVSWVKGFF